MADLTLNLTSVQISVICATLLTSANDYEKQATDLRQQCNRGMPARFKSMADELDKQAVESRALARLLNSAQSVKVVTGQGGAAHV
jgi:hypothetical protein